MWAVGSVGLPERTHIIHGDGTTWRPVESPDGADGESLADVAAWGRDDAFAVGSRHPSPPSPLADLAGWDTLAVRWDGARWATVPGPGQGLLSGVCAVGPGAYWAVGTTRIATRAGNFALVAHYADEHWQAGSEVPGSLSGVAATGPDDVWAVGRDQDPSHPPGPLILRYDGHTWAPAEAPVVDGNAWLEAVACAGRDNVWAVGGKERDDGLSGPFILHFDGSAWAAVEPPQFAASTGETGGRHRSSRRSGVGCRKSQPLGGRHRFHAPAVMSTGEATEMRLLLPAREPQRGLLREHISEEPVSLAVLASMCATVSPHKPMCDQRQVSTAPDRA